VRKATFSGISDEIDIYIARAVHRLRLELDADPIILPIAKGHRDAEVASRLIGARAVSCDTMLVSDAIQIAGECRVVLSGSYHAAVFALGQGIPVVGIIGSDYYRQKFFGLAGQFPGGCRIVDVRSPGFEAELGNVVGRLWKEADSLRRDLLQAAKSQIEISRSLYQNFACARSSVSRSIERSARTSAY
ncbi:MAG: polysaccharide pyruvyl transferase family protein, partial [Kiloniellales bacterium]|nr:polysaccharide pyruvyl transferase family protein [Kiloniellales bacterium]